MTETLDSPQVERELMDAVDADPRVVAALRGKNTFIDSSAGHHLNEAIHGREAWSAAHEDIKDTLESFVTTYICIRRAVTAELRPQFQRSENRG